MVTLLNEQNSQGAPGLRVMFAAAYLPHLRRLLYHFLIYAMRNITLL